MAHSKAGMPRPVGEEEGLLEARAGNHVQVCSLPMPQRSFPHIANRDTVPTIIWTHFSGIFFKKRKKIPLNQAQRLKKSAP